MTIYAHIDGASRGNPGESGVGIFLKDKEGNVLHSAGGYIGRATNNVAEYVALIECLKRATSLASDLGWNGKSTKLVVHSDSELLVRQIQGTYRVKNEGLRGYFQRVHRVLQKLPFAFEICHVPRELNQDADMLANVGIDSKLPLRPLGRGKRKSHQRV
jgi:ribonuclease HI